MTRDSMVTDMIDIGVVPIIVAATQTGTGMNSTGFDELEIDLVAGTFTGDGSMAVKVQKSDVVGGTYADVTGAAFTTITTANDIAIYRGRVALNDPANPFYRVLATYAGTGNAPICAVLRFGNPDSSARASARVFNVNSK